MSAPACSACRHSQYLRAEDQTVCLDPRVAEPSSVNPARIIGLDAGVCRMPPGSPAARELCGPAGRWFEPLNSGVQP